MVLIKTKASFYNKIKRQMSFGELKQWIVFNLQFVFNLQNGLAKYRADYFKVFSPKY
jgi:hypothetical protein